MSKNAFTEPTIKGEVYAPGYFLANNEEVTRFTRQFNADDSNAVTKNGGVYIPMGTLYTEDDSPVGFVYEDVDVTAGGMPGSVVLSGTVYTNRLPDELSSSNQTALEALGFVFLEESEVERPY